MHTHETHNIHRSAWLRAAVLGANDGIISTASLVVGVAAFGSSTSNIILVRVAALVAGAMCLVDPYDEDLNSYAVKRPLSICPSAKV